jgi:hypothetical protein
MAPVLPPLVEALPDGVIRVSLPTPFHVGRVNCYLLVDPPVTVIDPGTMQAGSIDELAAVLASSGLGFGDVEQIVVTHAHPIISVPRPLSPLARAHRSCAVSPNAPACWGRETPNGHVSFWLGSACQRPRRVR